MALRVETPQASLIRPGQLPIATANLQVPDIAGPLRRTGEQLMHKDDADARAKQAMIDQEKGQTKAGEVFVGKGPDGNYTRVDLPDGSPEYVRAFRDAVDLKQASQFEADLTKQLTDIQLRTDLQPEQKDAMMREAATAALESAPPKQKAAYAAWTNGEITRRTVTMAAEEAKRQEQLQVEGVVAGIGADVDNGASLAAAGGNPADQIGRIKTSYDTLVRLKRMSPEEAAIQTARAEQTIRANGSAGALVRLMLKGDISPDQLDAFANRVEDGAANEMLTVDGIKLGSERIRKDITDGDVRKQMAAQLRKAAADQAQRLQVTAKDRAFAEVFTYLGTPAGRTGPLPSAYRDDAEAMIGKIMIEADPFNNPQGAAMLTEALSRFKIAPKPLTKQLVAMVNSSDPQAMAKAVNVFQMMTTLQNKYGDSIGEQILADMDEDSRNLLTAYMSAMETGMPPADIKKAIKATTGPDALTMDSAIGAWGAAVDERDGARAPGEQRPGFSAVFWQRWAEKFGAGSFDAEAEGMFRRAYRANLAINGDPLKAFDVAFEGTSRLFTKSSIYTKGLTKTGVEDLTNPPGYEVSRKTIIGMPGAGTEYEWAENYLREWIGYNMDAIVFRDAGEDGGISKADLGRMLTAPTGSWLTAQTTPDFLGRTITLEPTDTNRSMPQFNIHMWDEHGNDLGLMYTVGPDGTTRPAVIDPHVLRNEAIAKGAKSDMKTDMEERRKRLTEAAGGKNRALRLLTIGGLPMEETARLMNDDAAFEQYLQTLPPEAEQQYRVESLQIKEGLDRALKRLDETGGTVPPGGASGGGSGGVSLMIPRAAGFDVTKAAVDAVEAVVPDGTGGQFMLRTAAHESRFGEAPGSFRLAGDRGIFQINTGSAFVEVKRRIALGKGRVAEAAAQLKAAGVVDLANVTEADLDKPVVSAAMARLYYLTHEAPIPKDLDGQARYWKQYYNTDMGAGTPEQFVASAAKVPEGAAPAGQARSLSSYIVGNSMVTSMTGQPLPANFKALQPEAQQGFLALSSAFGAPLRITPHGGRQADARKATSQHHSGLAMDVYIADMPDAEKTRLLALAIQQGATGIGGYARGDGKGTLHIDFRKSKGKGPGGRAMWWRATPGVDGAWNNGPAWFRAGIEQGLGTGGA